MASNQNKLPKDERKKLTELRKRTPEEWVERINALPSSIRPYAARIAWWDWFGNQSVADRWPHLDEYIRRYSTEDAPFEALATALETLGYPTKIAVTRAS